MDALDSGFRRNDDGCVGCQSEERNNEESQALLDNTLYILTEATLDLRTESEARQCVDKGMASRAPWILHSVQNDRYPNPFLRRQESSGRGVDTGGRCGFPSTRE